MDERLSELKSREYSLMVGQLIAVEMGWCLYLEGSSDHIVYCRQSPDDACWGLLSRCWGNCGRGRSLEGVRKGQLEDEKWSRGG